MTAADNDLIELRAIALKRLLATCDTDLLTTKERLARIRQSLLFWIDSDELDTACHGCGQSTAYHLPNCTQPDTTTRGTP